MELHSYILYSVRFDAGFLEIVMSDPSTPFLQVDPGEVVVAVSTFTDARSLKRTKTNAQNSAVSHC